MNRLPTWQKIWLWWYSNITAIFCLRLFEKIVKWHHHLGRYNWILFWNRWPIFMTFYEEQKKKQETKLLWSLKWHQFGPRIFFSPVYSVFLKGHKYFTRKKNCVWTKYTKPLKFISKKQWPKNNFHHSMPVTAQVTVSKCLLTVNSYTYLIRGWDAFLMIRVDASRPRPKYDFGLFPPSPLQTSSIVQHSRPKRIFILSKLTF